MNPDTKRIVTLDENQECDICKITIARGTVAAITRNGPGKHITFCKHQNSQIIAKIRL